MTRALPPLTWLRSFEASARHLSFTAAAQELGLTQSAVSQQVRALELRLGTDLFLRKPRGLALTDEGRKLAPRVGASLDQLAEATVALGPGAGEGLLTVAASVSVLRWSIAPRISGFLARRPDMRIRFLATIWPDEFRSPMADVEIRFGSAKQVGKGAERLGPDRLIPVKAPALTGPLGQQTLIETVGVSDGWREWSRAAGVPDLPKPALHVDSYGAALDFALGGAGVALTSSLLAAGALATGRLVQASTVSLPGAEGYFLALRTDTPAATAFCGWLRQTVGTR